nr:quinone oxidoreductase [Amycolatopsis sp.]
MRVIRYHEYGGPEVLAVEDAEVPTPGPGQVLIRTEAIGVNFIETQLRQDKGPFRFPLPGSPHGDVVGRVEAVAGATDDELLGRRVAAWMVQAAYADYVLADRTCVLAIPDSIEPAAATVLASPGQVAYGVLKLGRLVPGDTVLVHAAAGAIGHLVVQLAKIMGAGRVIGTAGSPTKLDFVRSFGADTAVSYRDADWPDQVRAATGGEGVDLVLDSVEGAVFAPSLDLLKPLGRLVYYGFAGAEDKLASVAMPDLFGLKYVVGSAFDAWLANAPAEAAEGRERLIEYLAGGRLRTAVHAVLPLDQAAKAHRIIEDRAQLGRVVLVP